MFRNYLAAALRNLARSRLYASISIFGLAVGMCAALLMVLILRNQYGYDRFIPGYDRIYLAVSTLIPRHRAPDYNDYSHNTLAAMLKLRFREVEATTRLTDEEVVLQRGETSAKEVIYWADPNFFDVLRLPVIAGDLATALRRPDSIVLPRAMARKYFGRDAPIGATLQLRGVPPRARPVGEALRLVGEYPMIVTAVIADLPVNGTTLRSGIFASGLASWSMLTRLDNDPSNVISPKSPSFVISVRTYFRLAAGAAIEPLQAAMPALVEGLWSYRPPGLRATLTLLRLDHVHLFPGFNPGVPGRLVMSVSVGLVILLIACINFINLSTARASRRAREVAVRKTAGASRGALVLQFLGESLIYVALATCMAVALTELALPPVNAFLNSGARFDYWRDPALIGGLVLGALTLSILAGLYPALVLSAFRPASVLKGTMAHSSGAQRTRQILVTLQFAVLIIMIVSAVVVYQQRLFATRDALRMDTDQHLIIQSPCRAALRNELQALAGVRGAACAGSSLLNGAGFGNIKLTNGTETAYGAVAIDAGLLELLDFKPVAGRFFSSADATGSTGRVIINETAVRRFGFASPSAAVGSRVPDAEAKNDASLIIGVVPDFSLSSVEREIGPTIYSDNPARFDLIDVKLTGRDIPETLAAIDRLWSKAAETEPPHRYFLNEYLQNLYLAVLRMAQAFAVMSCVAVLLACLGLIGLSAETTDRRTKEIGIRKAMGAGPGAIVRLLLWQFTKPVLWAAAVALPVSAYLMKLWLEGFAYHIDLTFWPFLAAGALALVIALLTVSVHCFTVARAKPVAALRYE
jgi:putative ABC transport system permease protein